MQAALPNSLRGPRVDRDYASLTRGRSAESQGSHWLRGINKGCFVTAPMPSSGRLVERFGPPRSHRRESRNERAISPLGGDMQLLRACYY
jgi:hypothetical protein